MRVVVTGIGLLCVSLVAGACVPYLPDVSEFEEFSVRRSNTSRPPFNVSPSSCEMPDALSVFSAAIHRQDNGEYSLEMEVFPAEFGPVDAETGDCPEDQQLWFTADGEEGCAAPIELPSRLLADTEAGQMREIFGEVYLDTAARLECHLGDPHRKCITTRFTWDEFYLADFPCFLGSDPINDAQSSEVLLFLEQLFEDYALSEDSTLRYRRVLHPSPLAKGGGWPGALGKP